MTIKTMMKRGAVKARTGMRTQDPRLAQHRSGLCLHQARGQGTEGRNGFSPPRMLSSQTHCSQKRGMGDGALRRNTESQGPQQPVEADKRKPLSPYYNDVLDAVQPRVISQEDAQFTPAVCHLHHPGVCGHIMTNRRRISTTRGRSSSAWPPTCPPTSPTTSPSDVVSLLQYE